jgi:hypothetical protein
VDRAGFQLEAAVAQGDNAAEGLLEPSTLSSAAALPPLRADRDAS